MVKPTTPGAPRASSSRRATPARRVAVGLALGLPLGVACSLSLDLDDTIPCSSDSECMYTNGQGSCQEGFCVPPGGNDTDESTGTTMTPDPSTSGPGTTVSLDSTTTADESSSGSSSGTTEGPPPACVVNSDCNDDQRCDTDNDTCVDLLSKECTTLRWPEQGMGKDNVVFLGSIMPTSPPFDTLVQPLENALQLAIDDFNEYATLQGGARIAWVGCDSTGGASVAVAAAEHLRDNVGVPAIVGPVFSEATRQVAENVTVPADIFLISPTASAPSLSNFDDDNLVWRVTPNDVYQGNALIDRFTIDLGIDPTASRVLVLNKDDAYGNELRNLIATDLSLYFDNIRFDSYPGPETFANMADLLASYGAVIGNALAPATGVTPPAMYANPEDHYTHILIIGTSEAEALIVSYLGAWAQNYYTFNPAIPLPLITVSHGAVPQMEQIVANVGVTPGTEPLAPFRPLLYANMRGTAPNIFDPDNFTAFNIRYQIAFGGQQALTSSSLSYDAGMAAMFAMVTVPDTDPMTGTAIANGMASLNDPMGLPISFGDQVADFVQDARNALANRNTVDLQGVSGALNWDPTNGELRADVLGWSLIGPDTDPQLNPSCIYLLNPEPAEDGTWLNMGTFMPPCG